MFGGNNFGGNSGVWQGGNGGGYNQGQAGAGYNQGGGGYNNQGQGGYSQGGGGYTQGQGVSFNQGGGSGGVFNRLGNRGGGVFQEAAMVMNGGGGRRQGMDGQGITKNYRPRIKEEGCPPYYNEADYQHMEPSMLNCGPCKKRNVWDGSSYLLHIRGRAHNSMVENLIQEETDTVASIREQMRVKAGQVSGEHTKCKMCNIKVKGGEDAMNTHRRSEGHQKLKRFIHPHCGICKADFELRSEWIYHRFSAEHLTNVVMMGRGAEDGVPTLEDMKKVLQNIGGGGGNKKNEKTKLALADGKKIVDVDAIILHKKYLEPMLKDVDLQNDEIEGSEFVKPVTGFFCKLCNNFFGPGKEVVKTHCTTKKHVNSLKTGGKRKAEDRASAPVAKKAK